MRKLIFAAIFLFSVSTISAQSLLAKLAFEDATRFASAGDFKKALKSYQTAFAASENAEGDFAIKLRYNLGVCNYRIGRLESAKAELSTAVRLSKGDHQRAYYALGMTESALENWPAARASFLKALELDPRDGEAWFDLAFVFLALHDYDQAAAAFRKSIENKSVDSALGHNNLGVIMAMKFEYNAAENAFNAALRQSNGKLIEARMNLEFCRALRGNVPQLIARIELNFAKRPGGPGPQAPSPA
jgi:tetratricopeptide (TPR) repeat protein